MRSNCLGAAHIVRLAFAAMVLLEKNSLAKWGESRHNYRVDGSCKKGRHPKLGVLAMVAGGSLPGPLDLF